MSSNHNSSSSDIGDGLDECSKSSHSGSFPQKRKGDSSKSSKKNTLGNSASEVTASEFLSRMDMSIEATRKNLRKPSPNSRISDDNVPSSSINDPLEACASASVGSKDETRIIC